MKSLKDLNRSATYEIEKAAMQALISCEEALNWYHTLHPFILPEDSGFKVLHGSEEYQAFRKAWLDVFNYRKGLLEANPDHRIRGSLLLLLNDGESPEAGVVRILQKQVPDNLPDTALIQRLAGEIKFGYWEKYEDLLRALRTAEELLIAGIYQYYTLPAPPKDELSHQGLIEYGEHQRQIPKKYQAIYEVLPFDPLVAMDIEDITAALNDQELRTMLEKPFISGTVKTYLNQMREIGLADSRLVDLRIKPASQDALWWKITP